MRSANDGWLVREWLKEHERIDTGSDYFVASELGGHDVCYMARNVENGTDLTLKDAQLISAAPDLYEALDMQIRNCPVCKGTGIDDQEMLKILIPDTEPSDCIRCSAGRQALKKARGEQ